jgi:hypothetical protein
MPMPGGGVRLQYFQRYFRLFLAENQEQAALRDFNAPLMRTRRVFDWLKAKIPWKKGPELDAGVLVKERKMA